MLNTLDNREVVITNDKAWGDVIINSSARSLRRLDLLFSIDYDDDLDKATRLITDILHADHRVRDEPPIWVKVTDLATSSVDIRARAWVSNERLVGYALRHHPRGEAGVRSQRHHHPLSASGRDLEAVAGARVTTAGTDGRIPSAPWT